MGLADETEDTLRVLTQRLQEAQQESVESLYPTLILFIYAVLDQDNTTFLSQCVPSRDSIVMYPTRQTGGFFESHLGSTMGYMVVKEFATGIPYEGF